MTDQLLDAHTDSYDGWKATAISREKWLAGAVSGWGEIFRAHWLVVVSIICTLAMAAVLANLMTPSRALVATAPVLPLDVAPAVWAAAANTLPAPERGYKLPKNATKFIAYKANDTPATAEFSPEISPEPLTPAEQAYESRLATFESKL